MTSAGGYSSKDAGQSPAITWDVVKETDGFPLHMGFGMSMDKEDDLGISRGYAPDDENKVKSDTNPRYENICVSVIIVTSHTNLQNEKVAPSDTASLVTHDHYRKESLHGKWS